MQCFSKTQTQILRVSHHTAYFERNQDLMTIRFLATHN